MFEYSDTRCIVEFWFWYNTYFIISTTYARNLLQDTETLEDSWHSRWFCTAWSWAFIFTLSVTRVLIKWAVNSFFCFWDSPSKDPNAHQRIGWFMAAFLHCGGWMFPPLSKGLMLLPNSLPNGMLMPFATFAEIQIEIAHSGLLKTT